MLKPIYENIPDDLRQYRQWVNWKSVPRKEGDKPTKPPFMPSGKLARTDDPSSWSHFLTAKAAADEFDGIGFVLTQTDPFVAFDFDNCRCPAFVGVTPWANSLDTVLPNIAALIRNLNPSYVEASPSGKGIRAFAKGKLPVDGKRKGAIEVYQSGRYVTLTGHVLDGFSRSVEPRQMEIDAFYKQVFGTLEEPPKQEEKTRTKSAPGDWRAMIEKAFESKSGPEIRRLWNGDFSAHPSQSEGDLALCSHLAFWLSRDIAAMDSAFRESGLFRKKWDEKHGESTYGEATIKKAIEGCTASYGDRASREGGEQAKPSPEEWSEPVPFNDYTLLPFFPVQAIPGVCGEMVAALADSCQVDAGLPGSMMLAVLSAAIGGKVLVDLVTHKEPGNDYFIAVIGSGNRKTEVTGQLAEPVYSYQRERQEALNPVIREAENRKHILDKRLEKIQKRAADQDDPMERNLIINECSILLQEIEASPVSKKPVYLVDDITPESLGQLMADNQERAAILSAEGGLFKIIGGLYHNGQANFDLFLKAHAGDAWSNNRIGREAKTMEAPALTLGLAVQPDVIEEIGRNSEFRGRGLSARFLYSWCQSKAGYRTRQSVPLPGNVHNAYQRLIHSLMGIEGKIELMMSPDGQAIWDGFYNEVEILLRPGGELEHLIDWGSKLPGAVARISGLLHFADSADGFPGNQISKNTVLSACVIGSYYLEHAKAVFGLMKEDTRITMAKRILDYIKRQKPTIFKGRDLFNHTNSQSMQEIQPGLNILVERGYIREFEKQTTEKRVGRPEATSYEVNPRFFSDL